MGHLQIISDLRKVWDHEEYDFTPWLKENIHLLAEQLDLEFEIEESEAHVGSFSADLVGKERNTGRRVVIENQLEATDHSHLGRLLTYAAGLQATVIVWVAKEIRDEHRAALERLNEHTHQGVDFFGVEIKLLKIDNSPLAPHFRLVVTPNQWYKETADKATVPTGKNEKYQRFWQGILDQLHAKYPGTTETKTAPAQGWLPTSICRTGVELSWSFSKSRLRVELYIHDNKVRYDQLFAQRESLESQLGSLVWERLETKKGARVYLATPGDVEVEANWPQLRGWGVETYVKMRKVLAPIAKSLV